MFEGTYQDQDNPVRYAYQVGRSRSYRKTELSWEPSSGVVKSHMYWGSGEVLKNAPTIKTRAEFLKWAKSYYRKYGSLVF